MTVRSILKTKGHQILSVDPDAKLSVAVKTLAERRIGAVLVIQDQHMEGILSERDIVRVLGERGASVLDVDATSSCAPSICAKTFERRKMRCCVFGTTSARPCIFCATIGRLPCWARAGLCFLAP